MKKWIFLVSVLVCFTAGAQDLPRKSSYTKIEQVVGLNKLVLEYSRPNVNDREIFGKLVPFNEVWRLGANEPTVLEVQYPIVIGEKELNPGKYAVFAIPAAESWKIVFNTDTEQWGAYDYDEKKNVLEYSAKVTTCTARESFEMTFDNVRESSAELVMRWNTTEVKVPFTTNTESVVLENIENAIKKGEDLAKVYYRAADYYNDHDKKREARDILMKSLNIERSYYNVFLMAQMEMSGGDKKMALELGTEAKGHAEKAEKQGWVDYIQEEVDSWK